METCTITVPFVPPSLNHYVMHTRGGRHVLTPEAKAFKAAVAVFAQDAPRWTGKDTRYRVEIDIWLGHNQKGDIDNFPKLVLDGVRDAGVIHTDAAVRQLTVRLWRDPEKPRTQIAIWADL